MRRVYLPFPGYVQRNSTKYQHADPKNCQQSPYQAEPIQYGTKVHQPVKSDTSALLSDKQIKRVQDMFGTFVWYGRACYPTLSASLSTVSSLQTKGTDAVMAACHQLLDYLATHPDAAICYHASEIILVFDTDASYLSELGYRIRAASYYYMTNKCQKKFNNVVIDVLSTIIKHVVSSASESETGSLYYRYNGAIPYKVMLQEIVHPQSEPTPVATNNNTAHGLTMGTMTSKASNSNDMKFQWLKFRKAQRMFAFLWARGPKNRSNYPSKHHHRPHHLHVRQNYVADKIQPS